MALNNITSITGICLKMLAKNRSFHIIRISYFKKPSIMCCPNDNS